MKTLNWIVMGAIILFNHSLSLATEYRSEVLSEVLQKVKTTIEKGAQPIVVLDLDDTLINTRDRNLRIIRDFIAQTDIETRFPSETALVRNIAFADMKYNMNDTLRGIGVTTADFLKEANSYWALRFFTNDYCSKDVPMAGAVDYARSLVDTGATLVYLTGRDVPRMGEGTRANLTWHQFPMDTDHSVLMMKPNKEMDDLAFKVGAFNTIENLGNIVAAFENEPANINALQKRFPDGIMVFIDSIHSPKPDVPNAGITWVKDFVAP